MRCVGKKGVVTEFWCVQWP